MSLSRKKHPALCTIFSTTLGKELITRSERSDSNIKHGGLYRETSLALWISQILLLIFKPTHKLFSAIGVHTRTIIFTHSVKKSIAFKLCG
jgi:hypothetical protein